MQNFIVSTLVLLGILSACSDKDLSKQNINTLSSERAGEKLLFDLNDVSILVKQASMETAGQYLPLHAETREGSILSESLFQQSEGLLKATDLDSYTNWGLVGTRIDHCAKMLPTENCRAEIRLVFQPFGTSANEGRFADQGLHLIYKIEDSNKLEMFTDFLNLKKSAAPFTTTGPLGPHPILEREGMSGPFAKRMNALVLKYALPSRLERIAVMGLRSTSIWEFAAATVNRAGELAPSPIPCQKSEDLSNTFFSDNSDVFGLGGGVIKEEMVGCDDRNFDLFARGELRLSQAPKEILDRAIKTDNPNLSFVGTTTCVSCHVASRRLDRGDANGLSVADDGNPLRFKKPNDVSTTKVKEAAMDSFNVWGMRAFGWGENFGAPGIATFTLNDTMRVAHELNNLIRAGEID